MRSFKLFLPKGFEVSEDGEKLPGHWRLGEGDEAVTDLGEEN